MNKLRFRVSNGDTIINLAVQAGKESCGGIVMSCTNIYYVCCSAENKSKQNRQIPVPTNSSRCTILHPQYKSSSTVSCLQKIRILTLIFGRRRRQFRYGLEKQCRALDIKHYSIPINMPVRWSSTHTMIDKFYRMKDAIIAGLASQIQFWTFKV